MRCAWILTLVLWLCGCGNNNDDPPPAKPQVPTTPDAALTWVRDAANDEKELRRRLEAWPMDGAAFEGTDETRTVLTWRMRLALQDGDVEKALRRLHMLQDLFGGEGLSPEGRTLPEDVMVGALFDESLYQARIRIEGPKPDLKRAQSTLDIARGTSDGSEEAGKRIRETDAWVGLAALHEFDLVVPTGVPRGTFRRWPCILVVADDFALGEGVFMSVLERWQRDGKSSGVEVLVLPVLSGQIRVGIRRLPAEAPEAENESIAERVKKAGLTRDPGFVRASDLTKIGLGPQETAILVANKEGQIIARLSGTNVDPRELDVVVERLISR